MRSLHDKVSSTTPTRCHTTRQGRRDTGRLPPPRPPQRPCLSRGKEQSGLTQHVYKYPSFFRLPRHAQAFCYLSSALVTLREINLYHTRYVCVSDKTDVMIQHSHALRHKTRPLLQVAVCVSCLSAGLSLSLPYSLSFSLPQRQGENCIASPAGVYVGW